MEALATYLIKSSVWLTGFALVYTLFLRNERFFTLNRTYLVSGILFSIIFPLFTWRYTVVLPMVPATEVSEPQVSGMVAAEESFSAQNALLYFYLSGIILLLIRTIRQTLPVLRIIRKSETHQYNSAKLIRTADYPASFSFFTFVFVNPSVSDTETNEIVNHEMEHIRQKHWIDLLLFEILRTMQWFNPMIWLYGHYIRQNHEYLADQRALQRSSDPAIYRAALLNQMFGGPVISLANSFNYSINKKRFSMMKQTISSPIRKLKLLLILPLIAGVFYAFATPEYKFATTQNEPAAEQGSAPDHTRTVKGKVVDENGNPLKSASVIISGKTIGTITDDNGNFMLKVTDDSPIVISYVGLETVKVNPDFEKEMQITMKGATISLKLNDQTSESRKKEQIDLNKPNILVIIDGKESTIAEMEKINPDKIASIDILKDKASAEKYGSKGKDGVIEITTKSNKNESNTKLSGNFIKHDSKDATPPSPGPIFFAKKIQGAIKNERTEIKADSISADFTNTNSLLFIDGKGATKAEVDSLNPKLIKYVSVLRGESAISKYGDKAKNGVVEITTKKQEAGFMIVEEMPQFPGGIEALQLFAARTMKYPVIALENGIQGRVFVKFVVDKTGKVTKAKVDRGVDPSIDKEAVRIVESMPAWMPGKQHGQAVDVAYTMPIDFKLPAEKISKEKLH